MKKGVFNFQVVRDYMNSLCAAFLAAMAFCSTSAQIPASLGGPDAAAFRLILSEDERKEFDGMESPEGKARWAKIYWKRRDPTPTTAKNERLEEYLRRLAHARRFFRSFTATGFDDRGEVYIKYGEPDQKYSQPVGTSFAKANESWSYHHIYPGLIFDFVSDGTAYSFTDDFRKAVVARSLRRPITAETRNLISIYQSRADLDLKYARTANALTNALNTAQDENHLLGLIQENLAEFAGEAYKIRIEAPVASYEYDYRKKPLHVATRQAQFRRPNGKVRLELYYGIPFNELEFARQDRAWKTPIVGKVAIFDSLYNPVVTDSFALDLRMPDSVATLEGFYTGQFNFLLPPAAYHATLRVENAPGNRLGILQTDIARPAFSFSPDSLAISDLQLSHRIAVVADSGKMQTESSITDDKFTKHGLRIAPFAGEEIPKHRMLFVYFEIYGLRRNANGLARYELQYTLKTAGKKKGLFGKIAGLFGGKKEKLTVTERREGKNSNPVEHIGIDLGEQSNGAFTLEVTVRDLIGQQEVRSLVPVVLKR